ncbi:hypothetical protein LMG8323_01112 [Ralstonia mannitolilytica]|nr:hypothetical protein LMG8323_01112 [Ralstonia mannitolilytica]
MVPVTRQCSGTALPPTLNVPAATVEMAVMLVLAKLSLPAKLSHAAARFKPVAGESCGSCDACDDDASLVLSSLQPAQLSVRASAASAMPRDMTVFMSLLLGG